MVGVNSGSRYHVKEETEGLDFTLRFGESGDESRVRDDFWGREGEEYTVCVG